MRKTIIAVVALSVAAAFTPSFAAGPVGPSSKVETEALAQVVQAKKKKTYVKRVKKSGKKAKSKGPGSCGAYMYYSKKTRKCMDARAKK